MCPPVCPIWDCDALRCGETLRGFRVDRCLGKGSFGTVYRATALDGSARRVAVKIYAGDVDDDLFGSLKAGDIGIADRAYKHFKALHRQSERGVFFVVREKSGMKCKVVDSVPKKDLPENILADETMLLTGQRMSKEYPCVMRRVVARVQVDGRRRTMVFLTNNFEWAASTIAELYKARWEVELLFKELKQTLQLQDFYGVNENAVGWQIWAALLTHLVLRWLKHKSRAACSYSRFAALVRAIVWLKKDAMAILRSCGIAPPQIWGAWS